VIITGHGAAFHDEVDRAQGVDILDRIGTDRKLTG